VWHAAALASAAAASRHILEQGLALPDGAAAWLRGRLTVVVAQDEDSGSASVVGAWPDTSASESADGTADRDEWAFP
jgi:hypothetical protein